MSRNFPYIEFAIEVDPRDWFPSWLNVASLLTHVEYVWTLIASNTSDTVGNRIRTTSVADFIITQLWHELLCGSFKRQICGVCPRRLVNCCNFIGKWSRDISWTRSFEACALSKDTLWDDCVLTGARNALFWKPRAIGNDPWQKFLRR